MTAKAKIELTAEDRASRVIGNVRQELVGMSSVGSRLGAVLGPLGGIGTAVGVLGGAGLLAIKNFAGSIDDLADTAEGLGVGAVALAEMRSKAAEAGVEAGALDKALAKVNAQLIAARSGDKNALGIFDALKIDVNQLQTTEQAVAAISDRLATYANTAERGALLSQIFGERIGPKLAAYLAQGSGSLRQFVGLTEDAVNEAAKLQREIDTLSVSFDRAKNSLLSGLIPAINDLIRNFGQLDFGKIRAEFDTFFLGNFGAAFAEYGRQLEEIGRKHRQSALAVREYAANYDEVDRLLRRSPGNIAPIIPPPEKTKGAARAVKELAEATTAYADSIRRAQLAESDRAGVAEFAALAAAEEKRLDLLDDAARLTGQLTRADRARLELIGELYEANRLTEEQMDRLTRQVYGMEEAIEEVQLATEKTDDFARDLGLTFSSAFEDAIAGGKGLSEVLKGLEQDIIRMVTRKLVTEPLANAIGGLAGSAFSTGPLAAMLSGLFGGGGATYAGGLPVFAKGGHLGAGQWGIAGEKGPELIYGGKSGMSVIPNGGGARNIAITVNVPQSTSGATANQIAATVARQLRLADARMN